MDIVPMTPIGELRLLRNVPLDSSYSDTLDNFTDQRSQAGVFKGYTYKTFYELGPIPFKNQIRLNVNANDVVNANYIMFQNANWSGKWFYAFITDIEFKNTNLTYISFEIDVIQTWYFNWSYRESFVFREHSSSDNIGDNIVLENVEHGDFVYRNRINFGMGNPADYDAVLCVSEKQDGSPVGQIYSNVYAGVYYEVFPRENIGVLSERIDWYVRNNKKDAILGLFMCPHALVNISPESVTHTFTAQKNTNDIDGYKPRNKKLFTYPYNYAMLSNNSGQSVDLRYEFMSNGDYHVEANMSINMEAICYPDNYAGISNNILYKVGVKGFPMCPYTIDTYAAWLAQNQGFQAINLASSAVSTALAIGSVATGNAGIAALLGSSSIAGIANTLETQRVHSSQPDATKGSNTASAEFSNGWVDFSVYNVTITAEYARIIDDYFDMFGYQTNKVKIPNQKGRKSWNYLQLKNPKFTGSVPFDDMEKIKSIYENGITFWHTTEVGNYALDNSIVG